MKKYNSNPTLTLIVLSISLGFLIGYVFRSYYAFHHHSPYLSKVMETTYSNEKIWTEKT